MEARVTFPSGVVAERSVRPQEIPEGRRTKDRRRKKCRETRRKPLFHWAPSACGTEPTNAVRGAQVVKVNAPIAEVQISFAHTVRVNQHQRCREGGGNSRAKGRCLNKGGPSVHNARSAVALLCGHDRGRAEIQPRRCQNLQLLRKVPAVVERLAAKCL